MSCVRMEGDKAIQFSLDPDERIRITYLLPDGQIEKMTIGQDHVRFLSKTLAALSRGIEKRRLRDLMQEFEQEEAG